MVSIKRLALRRLVGPLGAALLGGALWVSWAGAASPRFESLPSGQVTHTPTLDSQPDQVAASERVAGIYPALPPPGQMPTVLQGTRYVTVFSTEEAARQHSKGGFPRAIGAPVRTIPGVDKKPPPPSCFTAADQYHLKTEPQPWPDYSQEQVGIHGAVRGSPAAQRYQGAHVRALHREHLVVDGPDKATLHMTDVWVDPSTLGVRLIGKAKLTLMQLAVGPSDVRVFAARDPSGDMVHFVVQVPRPDQQSMGYWGRSVTAMVGSSAISSDCGHARMALPTVPGVGERATVQADVLLPSLHERLGPAAAGKGGATAIGTASPRAMGGPKEIRLRTLLVHLSVSQTASDPAPVISVSFGWRGREKRVQTY